MTLNAGFNLSLVLWCAVFSSPLQYVVGLFVTSALLTHKIGMIFIKFLFNKTAVRIQHYLHMKFLVVLGSQSLAYN